MGGLVVGTRQQLEIQTICKLKEGELFLKEAMDLLSVSERTVRRWLRTYEQKGIAFIKHVNCEKVPVNKMSLD